MNWGIGATGDVCTIVLVGDGAIRDCRGALAVLGRKRNVHGWSKTTGFGLRVRGGTSRQRCGTVKCEKTMRVGRSQYPLHDQPLRRINRKCVRRATMELNPDELYDGVVAPTVGESH